MTEIRYDFRSDTITRPTAAMRHAMAVAEVGDDVYGEDPTVNRLESIAAERLGKQAALFCTSGTQANLVALMSHCERGDEFIAGQMAHLYRWEAGGAAVLGSIQPQPVPNQPDGSLALDDIEAAIKPDDPHHARTRLLALENTMGGQILPQGYVVAACALARDAGLSCHLDGARIFNAAVARGVGVGELAAPFDTVSACLSKGLGAPIGSVLAGSHDLIAKGRRVRKILGGAMRQAGIAAAAGLYALDHNVERLADDHANASRLAEGLADIDGFAVVRPHTNIVFVKVAGAKALPLKEHFLAFGVGVGTAHGDRLRLVTHQDVGSDGVEAAIEAARMWRQSPRGEKPAA